MTKVLLRRALLSGIVLFLAIQFVPYGWDRTNPPVRQEPAWDSRQTRELAVRACFDCHSNDTRWPWYSTMAPMSWIVQHDVERGRRMLNYSEWDRPQEVAHESVEAVERGTMPPRHYGVARLSAAERQSLIHGLGATFDKGQERLSVGRGGAATTTVAE